MARGVQASSAGDSSSRIAKACSARRAEKPKRASTALDLQLVDIHKARLSQLPSDYVASPSPVIQMKHLFPLRHVLLFGLVAALTALVFRTSTALQQRDGRQSVALEASLEGVGNDQHK